MIFADGIGRRRNNRALGAGRDDVGGLADQLYRPQYAGSSGAHHPAGDGSQWGAVRVHHRGLLDCVLHGESRLGEDPGPCGTAARDDVGGIVLDGGLGGARLRRRLVELRGGARGAGLRRGRGLAVAYSGGSLGAVLTPLIVTPIFLWWGWRGAFWFTGFTGLAWLGLWAVVSKRPEVRRVRQVAVSSTPGPRMRDRRVWAYICLYALGALPIGFVLYSASLYLAHPLGRSQAFIGKVLWIPPLGWEMGYFVWGWLTDRGLRKGGSRRESLRRMLTWCAVLSLVFALTPLVPGTVPVLVLMFLAMFAASGFLVL